MHIISKMYVYVDLFMSYSYYFMIECKRQLMRACFYVVCVKLYMVCFRIMESE